MASVRLEFGPPESEGVTKLYIYEAPSASGPWNQIEVVTEVGTYPDYIGEYTTDEASSTSGWFRIAWEDNKGGISGYSLPIQGGTTTLVWRISSRVLLRDSSLHENVVIQTAEWVISKVMKTEDPYDVGLAPTLDQMEGMTLLTLARSILHSLATESSDESYTAGLVSQKSGSSAAGNRKDLVDYLIAQANELMGLNLTSVMLLADIDPTGLGSESSISYDQSRQAITINFE